MNIPHKRPKRYLAKDGILAADFLVSSLYISESMDLIKIEIECKITTKYAFFRFRVLGGAEIFVCHICRRGTLMFDGRYRPALHWGVWMMATLNSTSTSPEVGFSCSSRT